MYPTESLSPDLSRSRARAAVLSRDFVLAERLYKNLLKKHPENIDLLHELAAMYARCGQYESARIEYERILAANPDDYKSLLHLGGIYRHLHRYTDSVAVLDKALRINPGDMQIYYNLGSTYNLMGNYQEALDCFSTVIDTNPGDILAYNHLGRIYAALGKSSEAVSVYRRGLQMDSNHPVLHYNLARELSLLGRDEEAVQEYEAALRAKPGWSDAINGFALFLISRNRIAQAYDVLQQGLHVSPEDSGLQSTMGTLQLQRGDFDDAASYFKTVLNHNAEDSKALLGLADVYSRNGKIEKSIQVLERLPENFCKDEESRLQYIRILLNNRNYHGAAEEIRKFISSGRQTVAVLTVLAEYYICIGDFSRLNQCLKRIEKSFPGYIRHYLPVALRFKQTGDLNQAEFYIKKYLEHMPDDVNALTMLASCYELLKQYHDALRFYQQALENDIHNGVLKAAVERNKQAAKISETVDDLDTARAPERETALSDVGTFDQQEITGVLDTGIKPEMRFASGTDSVDFDSPSGDYEKTVGDVAFSDTDTMIFSLDAMEESPDCVKETYDPLEMKTEDFEVENMRIPSLQTLSDDGSPKDYEPLYRMGRSPVESPVPAPVHSLKFEDENGFPSFGDESVAVPPVPERPEPLSPVPKKDTASTANAALQGWNIPEPENQEPVPEQYSDNGNVTDTLQNLGTESVDISQPLDAPDTGFIEKEQQQPVNEMLQTEPPLEKDTVRSEPSGTVWKKATTGGHENMAALFHKMRDLCQFLPPLQKESFATGRNRLQMDFVIDRLDGRDGLLAVSEYLRKTGIVDVPEGRYDIVEKFDNAAFAGRVFSIMRQYIHALPDKNMATALDTAVTQILEQLAGIQR